MVAVRMGCVFKRSCRAISYEIRVVERFKRPLLRRRVPRPISLPARSRSPIMTEALWHGTTILSVRKGGQVVIAGDGQVSMGNTIVKANARKLRRLGKGDVIAGFAGATADAFALFERLEAKLETHPGNLARACVELAKDWRTH